MVTACLSFFCLQSRFGDTYFAGCTSSKDTWMHPHSRRWHQLDHVIVRRRQLNEVNHCSSMHSVDCYIHHALVRCKLALRSRKFHMIPSRPFPPSNFLQSNPVKTEWFQTLFCSHFASSSPAITDSALIACGWSLRKQPEFVWRQCWTASISTWADPTSKVRGGGDLSIIW